MGSETNAMGVKKIEVSDELYEQIKFLKQALPDEDGNPITDDAKVLELIVGSFMGFIEEQAHANDVEGGGECCGGGSCSSH